MTQDQAKVISAPILSAEQATRLQRTSWWLVESAADSRSIVVQTDQGSGCSKPGGLRVTETNDAVSISSYVDVATTSGPCLSYRYEPKWRVQLRAPLGHRVIRGECHGRAAARDCRTAP